MKSPSTRAGVRTLLFLLGVNHVIMSRSSRAGRLTPILFALGSAVLFGVSVLLVRVIEEPSLGGNIRMIGMIMYMVVIFDVMFSVARYSTGNAVHVGHLFVLPLSFRFLMIYLAMEKMFSAKSLIYLGFALGVTYRVFAESPVAGIVSVVLFSLYFMLLEVWITALVLVIGKTLARQGFIYPLLLIGFLFPVYLAQSGIMNPTAFARFCSSGIFGIVGEGIGLALDSKWSGVGMISLELVALASAGLLAGIAILRSREVSAY